MTHGLLQPGKNCWRVEPAGRFATIIDAQDYFNHVRQAMLAARESITLIGWDFDPRIEFGKPDDGPEQLGDFVIWLVDRCPSLHIRILRWDTGALKAMLRGGTLPTVLRWKMHERITMQLDSHHPVAASHHQKIVAIDDSIAFCGGIDMTVGRWDTRAHKDEDPRRTAPDGTPQPPWHDATSAFDGPAALAMADLTRERWRIATDETLQPSTRHDGCWPEGLEPLFENVQLAIARTRPDMPDAEGHHEIEAMYLDLIGRAKTMIYAESQYFASRKIARAIAQRLGEADGPEIVIVNPVNAEGWLRSKAMDSARARLIEALRRQDRHGRLRVYHPLTEAGEEIYVHAKVMVVDDKYLRVGSSNFNNRSMRLDTECDVIVAADEPGNDGIDDRIAAIQNDLIAEHLAVSQTELADTLARTGSLIQTIESLRAPVGQGRTLRDYELPELDGAEEWLADNEILDPEGPDMVFEPLSDRGLFKNWGNLGNWFGGQG